MRIIGVGYDDSASNRTTAVSNALDAIAPFLTTARQRLSFITAPGLGFEVGTPNVPAPTGTLAAAIANSEDWVLASDGVSHSI